MPDLRRATPADIARLMQIRAAVQENRLSDPQTVTFAHYASFITRNRVWVAQIAGQIAGFSASDPADGTIWALFVDPGHQGSGLGTRLLHHACADLRHDGFATARLTTDPGTRAEALYRKLGWQDGGPTPDGEMRFALSL